MAEEFDDDGPDDERLDEGDDAGRDEPQLSGDGYEVGYRKPPRHSRFKPGESGNLGGRKKGSRGLKTDLHAELNRIVEVKIGTYTFKGTTQQLMLRTLALLAANGNLKASGQLLPLVLNVFGAEDRRSDKRTLSPQDQAVLDNFLAAFGGDAAGDNSSRAEDSEDDPVPSKTGDLPEGEP